MLDNGEKTEGYVRDKITFGEKQRSDGTVQPPLSRYFCRIKEWKDREEDGMFFDAHRLSRDRRVFSKQILRSFLKNSLTREAWSGAPWMVKEGVAKTYKINREVPSQLTQSARSAERKASIGMGRGQLEGPPGTFFSFLANQQRPLDIRPGPKGTGRGKMDMQHVAQDPRFIQYHQGPGAQPYEMMGQPPPQFQQMFPGVPFTHQFGQHPYFQP
ncbi:hypothetical protein LTS18_015163, partial [Coniosporium uncinatum]